MAAPTTADEAIKQNILGPASVSIDGRGTVSAKDVDQIIKGDQYAIAKANAAKRRSSFGLQFAQVVPPGAG